MTNTGKGKGKEGIRLKSLVVVLFAGLMVLLGSAAGAMAARPQAVSGYNHSLAIKEDGTVWAWGDNSYGQLGDGTTGDRSTPVQVTGLTGVRDIDGGGYHSLALKDDGTVWAWGDNRFGQLGNDTISSRSTPVQVTGLMGVRAIAAGNIHSLALKDDGTVWAWGSNYNGQLGNGTTVDSSTPVQVSGLTGVRAIAAGLYHGLALKEDGTVWAWGYNYNGQLGNGTTVDSPTPVQVTGLTGVRVIAAGGYHSLALKEDGTVWVWGYNGDGQLGDGTTNTSPVPVQVQDLNLTDVQYYTVTDLGTLGGTYSAALGINNYGQVVGYSSISGDTTTHAFLYENGSMTDLGTLGGSDSLALGINEYGQVVGVSYYTSGDATTHAFLYDNGTMTDLGTLGGTNSWASAVNDYGQVVGAFSTNSNTTTHAFLYDNGTMTDLGTMGGTHSDAKGINNYGQVVGAFSTNSNTTTHAFLYNNGTMTDLGTLGGTHSDAKGINNYGQVVGYSLASGNKAYHAFLYDNGSMIDLGTLGGTESYAYGINDYDQVVGLATNLTGAQLAFIHSHEQTIDLNTLIDPAAGWMLQVAYAINNQGQIVGWGTINGQYHAFLLTPAPAPDLADFTITASADSYGAISPSGSVSVAADADQTFAITPHSGYQVADVLVDGVSVGPVTSYTFTQVTADHTIEATFVADQHTDSDIHVIPYPSGLSSEDTDLVVAFNGSRSTCYELVYDGQGIANQVELTCEYSWDFGGAGTVVGGNGADVVFYAYDAPGIYTATLTVIEPSSGVTSSKTMTATAALVESNGIHADFATSVNGNTVTLTAPILDASVVRAYIFWGDRQRTVSTNAQEDLTTGITYTYGRGGRDYNIRVQTIDAAHNKTDYTFSEDEDLKVTIP